MIAGGLPVPDPQSPVSHLDELIRRAPEDLQKALLGTIHCYLRFAGNGVELLDAIDEARAGLGVAIGRGETHEDQRYEQLGRLCVWLHDELGRPANTRYAAVLRAAAALEANDERDKA